MTFRAVCIVHGSRGEAMSSTDTERKYNKDTGGGGASDAGRSDIGRAYGVVGASGAGKVSHGRCALIVTASVLGALTLLLGILLVLALRRDDAEQPLPPETTEDTAARERESALESERDALRAELDGIQLTKDEQLLLERIKEKDVRIEELQSMVDLLSQSFTPELRRQAELFSELGSLTEERP